MPGEEREREDQTPGRLAAGLLGLVALELRERVAPATAAVEGLRDPGVRWTEEQRSQLLAVAQDSLDEVALLLRELAAVHVDDRPVGPAASLPATPLQDLVLAAADALGEGWRQPSTRLPASLPSVLGEPVLLRLALASLLQHTVRTAETHAADVRAVARGNRVLLRIGGDPPADGRWPEPAGPAVGDRARSPGSDVGMARRLVLLLGGAVRAQDDGAVILELPAAPATAKSPRSTPG